LATGRLKNVPYYKDGFKPKLGRSKLNKTFRQGLIFLSSMGDLWGPWVPDEWITEVLVAIRKSPNATFLALTKNPERYHQFLQVMPQNMILGTTIETNRQTGFLSKAPSCLIRTCHLASLHGFGKMVSIEPILEFDVGILTSWIRTIRPSFVYVGYDNHGHKLNEPSLADTEMLIKALSKFTEVRRKTIRKAWWER